MAFSCTIDGCTSTSRGNAEWCRMHYMRWWRHGDPLIDHSRHRFAGSEVTYHGAHARVRAARGSASALVCSCGALAAHWAYSHADPNEKRDERGRPYSPDPEFYEPMCVPCHKRSDLTRLEKSA